MNSTPNYEQNDILIIFRDMLVHILRRWRSIVIGILVVTLLTGGFQYMRDQKSYSDALAAEKDKVSTIRLEELSLANANQVIQYQKIYKAQAEYNHTAPLMQIDSSAINTTTLSYLITGSNAYVTAGLYQTQLNTLSLYEALAADITPQYEPSHLMELVTVTLRYDPNDETATKHVALNIEVIAPTKELCAAIADAIQVHMRTLTNTVTGTVGTHNILLAANTVQCKTDISLRNEQQNNLNACNTLRTNLKAARDALSADERAYVDQMVTLNDNKDNEAFSPKPPSISKKMLIIGFGAGLVLMVLIHALGYILLQKVKSREDFIERYGMTVFGTLIPTTKKHCLTDRVLRRLFFKKDSTLSAEETNALSRCQFALAVKTMLADTQNPTILVVGSTDKTAELFSPLVDVLAKDGMTLSVIPNPICDVAALERLTTADAVVLAETVGVSRYNDIYHKLDLCKQFGCPVLGAFMVE